MQFVSTRSLDTDAQKHHGSIIYLGNPSDVSQSQTIRRCRKGSGERGGDTCASKLMTPNPALTGTCCVRIVLGGELLAQNTQSRKELIGSNVSPTHPALTGKRRAAVQHAMIINR